MEFVVFVEDISSRRGPAVKARTLYRETEESVLRREQAADERRLKPFEAVSPNRRPDKRDRRKIRKFIRKD
jgi:ribosome-associated heat shock protein Hsp15